MGTDKRERRVAREKGKAVVRALHLGELEAAGEARSAALREADKQLDRVARFLPEALEAGITLAEVARVTGVSRPTLYELRGRYETGLNLALAVLQAIATRSPLPVGELPKVLKRSPADVAAIVKNVVDQGFVDYEVDEAEPDDVAYVMTADGYELLEQWRFDVVEAEQADRHKGQR